MHKLMSQSESQTEEKIAKVPSVCFRIGRPENAQCTRQPVHELQTVVSVNLTLDQERNALIVPLISITDAVFGSNAP